MRGYYKDNSENRFGNCRQCPEGYTTDNVGATNIAMCNTCEFNVISECLCFIIISRTENYRLVYV